MTTFYLFLSFILPQSFNNCGTKHLEYSNEYLPILKEFKG